MKEIFLEFNKLISKAGDPKTPLVVILGYIFALIPLLFMPIIFIPLAIIFGIVCLFRNRVGAELVIIFLAICCGIIAAYIGGWGLFLPRLGDRY